MCMRGTQARPRDPCCIRSVRLQNMQAVRMQHGTCRPPSQQKCCSARARVPSCSIHPRQQIASAPAKALSQRAGACGASSWLPTAVGAACAAAVAVQLVSCSRCRAVLAWRGLADPDSRAADSPAPRLTRSHVKGRCRGGVGCYIQLCCSSRGEPRQHPQPTVFNR
jgi:hypothetical protein